MNCNKPTVFGSQKKELVIKRELKITFCAESLNCEDEMESGIVGTNLQAKARHNLPANDIIPRVY